MNSEQVNEAVPRKMIENPVAWQHQGKLFPSNWAPVSELSPRAKWERNKEGQKTNKQTNKQCDRALMKVL